MGTTEGYVFVLEILATTLRESEYMISLTDTGISASMSVSDIQIHPKVCNHKLTSLNTQKTV